ncbi:MAG: hypothetical protein COV44_03455 [Deltaproteobacteria bacterium CG11_big_fil_rev_8_21_14_0_20_45_16]|nr:MAG: hypothetical protein COV44_03455 [Deltaproteobacteria bacterium CG11_big_fil_rev_8_21_14_0_20_45_16]
MKAVPHNLPSLGNDEAEAASKVIRSGWVAQGPEVRSFEEEFASYLGLGAENVVAVSSGSAALFLALKVLGAEGKKVATPVYACAALRNAIALAGGQAQYLDNSPESPLMNLSDPKIKDAKILIAAHMFGIPLDISSIKDKIIIEDVAQALGASLHEKKLGTLGHCGIFSFYATKLITSGGQGGMFVSLDASLAAGVRDYREFDARRDTKIRFNFQMTDLQAAIGRVQLKNLPAFLRRREEIYLAYVESGLPVLRPPLASQAIPVRYRSVLKCTQPKKLQKSLEAQGIKTIVPIEDWELQDTPVDDYPMALDLCRSTLSLPCYPFLSKEDQQRLIEIAKESEL